jgi:hypothetical protein
LISWGGTSIWFNAFAIGIILSVSRHIEERPTTTTTPKKEKKKIIEEIHG